MFCSKQFYYTIRSTTPSKIIVRSKVMVNLSFNLETCYFNNFETG